MVHEALRIRVVTECDVYALYPTRGMLVDDSSGGAASSVSWTGATPSATAAAAADAASSEDAVSEAAVGRGLGFFFLGDST